ncbi:MAG: N-6 DNA methylase [Planctomycetia bacterium]|nr:N-6 DNA methylase [Planctomycetia bacterium]
MPAKLGDGSASPELLDLSRAAWSRGLVKALCGAMGRSRGNSLLDAALSQWSSLFSLAGGPKTAEAGGFAKARVPAWACRIDGRQPSVREFHFALHTAFSLAAKLLAYEAIRRSRAAALEPPQRWIGLTDEGLSERLDELERGEHFSAAAILPVWPRDLFSWHVPLLTPDAAANVRALLAEFGRLEATVADASCPDALKGLYQALVPPFLRKALGEFYTPDWLARRLLAAVAEKRLGDPGLRIVDPACGSGTFLALAVHAVRASAGPRLLPADLLRSVCNNIVGIDVNPLAVVAARANYLLALGPLLSEKGNTPVEIPVYLGDSILGLESGAGGPALGTKFDCVVGNPPWVTWDNLPRAYREKTRPLWESHGLFPHRGLDTILGKGKKDLSMLMTYTAADRFLSDGGRLGFVITQSVFKTAGAAQGFRRFRTGGGAPLRCLRVEDYSALRVFPAAASKTAVVVLEKGQPQAYPVQYVRFSAGRKQPQRGRDDRPADPPVVVLSAREEIALPSDPADPTSAWLTAPAAVIAAVKKLLGRSDYRAALGVNTGGANGVYWFGQLEDAGDGTVWATNLASAGKREIAAERVRLERALLFPLVRGGDASPFCAAPSAWILFVQDPQARSGLAQDVLEKYPLARAWLRRHEALLRSRAAYRRYFDEHRDPFWTMFNVGPYTLAPWKVVWPRLAGRIAAAVVSQSDGQRVLVPETFAMIGLTDPVEAHFVAGVMNSTPLRAAVECISQPGSKSFGTPGILERVRVPRFDGGDGLHRQIADAAHDWSSNAAGGGQARQASLDRLCARLYGMSDGELAAWQGRDG